MPKIFSNGEYSSNSKYNRPANMPSSIYSMCQLQPCKNAPDRNRNCQVRTLSHSGATQSSGNDGCAKYFRSLKWSILRVTGALYVTRWTGESSCNIFNAYSACSGMIMTAVPTRLNKTQWTSRWRWSKDLPLGRFTVLVNCVETNSLPDVSVGLRRCFWPRAVRCMAVNASS